MALDRLMVPVMAADEVVGVRQLDVDEFRVFSPPRIPDGQIVARSSQPPSAALLENFRLTAGTLPSSVSSLNTHYTYAYIVTQHNYSSLGIVTQHT